MKLEPDMIHIFMRFNVVSLIGNDVSALHKLCKRETMLYNNIEMSVKVNDSSDMNMCTLSNPNINNKALLMFLKANGLYEWYIGSYRIYEIIPLGNDTILRLEIDDGESDNSLPL
jgi:hypothetical protein